MRSIKRTRIFRFNRENRAARERTWTRAFERTTRAFGHENTERGRERESVCSRACWCKVVTWVAYKDRLKSISPDRVMGGNLRRISREGEGRRWYFLIAWTTRQSRTEISVRGIDVRFEGGEWRKREKTTRFSRGWQLQLSFMRRFFSFFFFALPHGLLYDKSQRDEWAKRSIGPNDLVLSETRVLSPRCEEDRNPADGEIAEQGGNVGRE